MADRKAVGGAGQAAGGGQAAGVDGPTKADLIRLKYTREKSAAY
jgi:hypothetical protein